MIDPKTYADKQMELCVEFAQYVVDHPEVDEVLPAKSHIFFEVEGEPEFSQFSRESAEREARAEGLPAVAIRIKGLAAPQGSRLIDPRIEPVAAVA